MVVLRLAGRLRTVVGASLVALAVVMGLLVRLRVIVHGDSRVLAEFLENRRPGFTLLMRAVTWLFNPMSATVLAAVVTLVVWWATRAWRSALLVVAAVGLSGLLTHALKLSFERARPPLLTRLTTELNFSFPSGHATAVAALGCSIGLVVEATTRSRRVVVATWCAMAVLVAAVASSRLYLGVHWFTDVLAGCLVGAGVTLVLSAALQGDRSAPAPGQSQPSSVRRSSSIPK